jgi:hypothetical protein
MSIAIKLTLGAIGLCIIAIALLSWQLGKLDIFLCWILPMIVIRLLAMFLRLNLFSNAKDKQAS